MIGDFDKIKDCISSANEIFNDVKFYESQETTEDIVELIKSYNYLANGYITMAKHLIDSVYLVNNHGKYICTEETPMLHEIKDKFEFYWHHKDSELINEYTSYGTNYEVYHCPHCKLEWINETN